MEAIAGNYGQTVEVRQTKRCMDSKIKAPVFVLRNLLCERQTCAQLHQDRGGPSCPSEHFQSIYRYWSWMWNFATARWPVITSMGMSSLVKCIVVLWKPNHSCTTGKGLNMPRKTENQQHAAAWHIINSLWWSVLLSSLVVGYFCSQIF